MHIKVYSNYYTGYIYVYIIYIYTHTHIYIYMQCMGVLHSERLISIVANQLLSGMVPQETWNMFHHFGAVHGFLEAPRHELIQESSSDSRSQSLETCVTLGIPGLRSSPSATAQGCLKGDEGGWEQLQTPSLSDRSGLDNQMVGTGGWCCCLPSISPARLS